MDEYQKLANNTRNLEQKYTEYIIEKYARIIDDLKSQPAVAPSEELERKIDELNKEKTLLEERLKESQLRIVELENEAKKLKENSKNIELKTVLKEMKILHEETLNLIKKLTDKDKNSNEENKNFVGLVEYQNRIKALENEIDDLRSENTKLKKNEQLTKEQKDNIVLLKDSLENKEKIIQSQKQEINKLNEQIKKERLNNPFGKEDLILEPIKDNELGNIVKDTDPWNVKNNKTEIAVKKPKTTKNESKKKVNVANIMKEDNKSFFNDLSFSNSSPVIEKSFRKPK